MEAIAQHRKEIQLSRANPVTLLLKLIFIALCPRLNISKSKEIIKKKVIRKVR